MIDLLEMRMTTRCLNIFEWLGTDQSSMLYFLSVYLARARSPFHSYYLSLTEKVL